MGEIIKNFNEFLVEQNEITEAVKSSALSKIGATKEQIFKAINNYNLMSLKDDINFKSVKDEDELEKLMKSATNPLGVTFNKKGDITLITHSQNKGDYTMQSYDKSGSKTDNAPSTNLKNIITFLYQPIKLYFADNATEDRI